MITEIIYVYLLGLLSILSPCTFIIVPVMVSDINTKLTKVLSFLGGIVVTFGILGILSALTGKLLTNFIGGYLYFFAGVITLIMGLHMMGVINFDLPSFFSHVKTKNNFLLGLIYGGVALSCIGPLLSVILVYITTTASIISGLFLMSIFSLGFITPFVLFGILITDKSVYRKLIKHALLIRKIGGVMLLLVSAYLLFVGFRGII